VDWVAETSIGVSMAHGSKDNFGWWLCSPRKLH
jgi:hypothetical protein